MVKVGVIGATGFTGEELVRLLITHPKVKITYLSAKLDKELPFSEIFPKFKGKLELICENLNINSALNSADLFFLALPHRVSFQIAPLFLNEKKPVIDLSADYRFKDPVVYKKFYKIAHQDKKNLKKAVYGLPEFYREKIKKARLIANPGCYPTVSILSIAPLLREGVLKDIVIDAKSGVSGAGRRACLDFHYVHLSQNLTCYKPFGHQHLPEIVEVLSVITGKKPNLRFTPHLLPLERGIFVTIYAQLTKKLRRAQIYKIYKSYYEGEPFVRIFKEGLPQLKEVVGTNFCDLGFELSGNNILIVGVIDNLIKGASGQAIQNMNILLGFKESEGLE